MSLRVLVLSELLPRPDRHSGDLRFFGLLTMLGRRHRVDLWVINEPQVLQERESARYVAQLEHIGVRVLSPRWRDFTGVLAGALYDIGFFEFYRTAVRYAASFRRRQPGASVIVDSVDVHFAREAQAAELGLLSPADVEKTRQDELGAYRGADAVLAVTEMDRDILHAEEGMPPVFVVPNVVPTRPRPPGPRACEAVFVGGFRWPPNADGIRWFVTDIWPTVRAAVPEARLTVVGSNPTSEVLELASAPGVTVTGYVPETAPYLDRAAVSVAPLRYGGGMKGKVNEAMASGLPVVTTTVGAQGLQATSGEHLLIADREADFARALITLFKDADLRERIGLAGQRHNAALCSPEVVELALEDVLKSVAPTSRSARPAWKWRAFALAYHAARPVGVPWDYAWGRVRHFLNQYPSLLVPHQKVWQVVRERLGRDPVPEASNAAASRGDNPPQEKAHSRANPQG